MQRDRVRQVFPVLDQFQQECLSRGRLEGVDDSEEQGKGDHVRHLDQAEKGQHSQRQRLQKRERLDDHQQVPAVHPIGPHAGDRRQEQHWQLLRSGRYAEEQGGAGQPVNQPAHRHRLHPGPEERETLPGVEDAEVAGAKGA